MIIDYPEIFYACKSCYRSKRWQLFNFRTKSINYKKL